MSFFGIDTWEMLILVALAAFLIGPERLPEYLTKLRGWIRQARDMAEDARTSLKDQMGPDFQDVDWRQYDPRQYDPRKIIREAFLDEDTPEADPHDPDPASQQRPVSPPLLPSPARFDPDRATPYDDEAT